MLINILGHEWKIKVLRTQEFIKAHGDAIGAITDTHKRCVEFKADDIRIIYVRHELFHCYFESCFETTFGENLHLDQAQLEELAACITGEHGEELVKLSKKVYNYIKKRAKALAT